MKYGFVYVWRDRRDNRYYIGCRWGNVNDGYVCSSRWMKSAYKLRPQDFKRRVLAKITSSREDLLIEEHRWLQMIGNDELGNKYYNLTNHQNGSWSIDPVTLKNIGEKISYAHRNNPNFKIWNKGISMNLSEESKQKRSSQMKERWQKHRDGEIVRNVSHAPKNTPEVITKRKATMLIRGVRTGMKVGTKLPPRTKEHVENWKASLEEKRRIKAMINSYETIVQSPIIQIGE